MEVNIIIDKSSILTEVYKITGYTGKKAKKFDDISSTSDEEDILDSYFTEGITAISDIISRYGYLSDNSIKLTMPANYNINVNTALTNAMKQYVIDYICMQWFNMSNKDDVKYYAELLVGLTLQIRKYLMERTKPIR